jgi:ribonuclease HI
MDFLWEIADEIRKNGGYVIIDPEASKRISKRIMRMINNKRAELYIYKNHTNVSVVFDYPEIDNNENIATLYEIKNIYKHKNTSNDKMEILAHIDALETVMRNIESIPKNFHNILVYTESEYMCNVINQGWLEKWKKNNWVPEGNKAISNVDLLDKLYTMIQELKERSITFYFNIINDHSINAAFYNYIPFDAVEYIR